MADEHGIFDRMFIGHYSTALAAKAIEPRLPLWQGFVAAQLVDIAFVGFVFTGVEHMRLDPSLPSNPLVLHDMPYSHSLVATAIWALASFVVLRFVARTSVRVAALLAAVVASHWFLDLLVHRPDLVLVGEHKVGLSLWNVPWLALALEVGVFVAAAAWLLSRWPERGERRRWLVLFGAMALVQVGVLVAPLPSTETGLLLSTLSAYLALPAIVYALERRETH